MTPEKALRFIRARAKEVKWSGVAEMIGESEPVVYGWHRREKVPRWRLPAIEAAAEKHRAAEHEGRA